MIFTDIRMPVCDGLELIDRVHAMGLSPYIVVLSAFDDFPQVKQAFKKGASDYVLKQEVTADKLLELCLLYTSRSSACRKRFWQYRL